MARLSSLWLLASLAASVSATGVLLPLYIYPSLVFGDGAANWDPIFSAVSAHPKLDWLVVINPGDGPGASGQPGNADQNYIDGVSKLNAYPNVKTVGYVHTLYTQASLTALEANITTWNGWSSYKTANVSVEGIFFDESAANFTYLSTATSFARQTFGRDITIICNFGAAAASEYYGICDVIVASESCLNCANAPQYKSRTTLIANIPTDVASQAAVIVHDFAGNAYDGSAATAALLNTYIKAIADYGVGWCYFCSAGYDSDTTAPATVGAVAGDVAST